MLSTTHNQPERRYLVRWRFDYLDGKPTKFGSWSRPAADNDPSNQAWRHNTKVSRAIVEGKDIRTREVSVLADCRGEDFVNFQWNAVARMNPLAIRGEVVPFTQLAGLKIVTRYTTIDVFETGEVFTSPRPEDNYNYATFGR